MFREYKLENRTHLVASDEGPGGDPVDYDSSTSEAIGSDICVGYGQVCDGPDSPVHRGG